MANTYSKVDQLATSLRRTVGAGAMLFVLTGCEAEFSISTASLSEEKMASAINAETMAPTMLASTFVSDVPAIYATAKVSNAPEDTKVKATFHYLEDGERQIAEDEIRAGGSRYVAPAQAGVPQLAMKRFRDARFGIELELPSLWTARVTESKDYLFEGPKGTDAFELSVVLQFVLKTENPGSSAAAQIQEIAGQLQRAPGGVIKTRETLTIAGQEAPYFSATYTAADSRGVATPFAHTQLVVDHGAYYYLVSYSGPVPIYQKHLTVFQHLVETLRFIS